MHIENVQFSKGDMSFTQTNNPMAISPMPKLTHLFQQGPPYNGCPGHNLTGPFYCEIYCVCWHLYHIAQLNCGIVSALLHCYMECFMTTQYWFIIFITQLSTLVCCHIHCALINDFCIKDHYYSNNCNLSITNKLL